ncbi:MAG: hypothetical protein ABJA87_12790 [bacterium]
MLALALLKDQVGPGGTHTYNEAIPYLVGTFLPNGVLGVALTGLLAAFMAGMAANISSCNTVWTYDVWRPYLRPGREDAYYLRHGRIVTVVGIVISVGTAFIAAQYENLFDYIHLLFSFFNAPLFATFLQRCGRPHRVGTEPELLRRDLRLSPRPRRVHRGQPGHESKTSAELEGLIWGQEPASTQVG